MIKQAIALSVDLPEHVLFLKEAHTLCENDAADVAFMDLQ